MTSPVTPQLGRVASRLARIGFTDSEQAGRLLTAEPVALWDAGTNAPVDDRAAAVVSALSRVAAPDEAVVHLVELLQTDAGVEIKDALLNSSSLRQRLLSVLGLSTPLARHLIETPRHWRLLSDETQPGTVASRLAAAVGADADDPVTGTDGTRAKISDDAAVTALRTAYQGELLSIAGRDLAEADNLERVTEELAELADATLAAALAVAAARLPRGAAPCRLAIVAMGKTGGRELNYISDVDVVFVADGVDSVDGADAALDTATRLARETMRVCREVAWEVDANLRPEGRDGALVRTVASHRAYYQRWAKTWEFQALLKARPAAGDSDLGRDYLAAITPFVWQAAERADFVTDVRAMRRRVVAHIRPGEAARELKLGAGGLRDVEFAVQLLQLVHGRADESLRVRGTLPALRALRDGGYVGRDDAVSLADAYVFLRANEHRLQLHHLRRTHLLPETDAGRAWLARAMSYRPDSRGDARTVWEHELALHRREVRRLHEKLFYRPLLEAVARVPAAELRLSTDEAGRRLAALGFADAPGALRHIDALTSGLSRRAALQRTLLPVILGDLADSPDPDGGLLAYRRLSDELGETAWYLRTLRDEGKVAARLACVLGTSRYASRMLLRAPDALGMLGSDDDLRLREYGEIASTMAEITRRHLDPQQAVRAVRGVRRTELLRIAFADLVQHTGVDDIISSLSAVADASIAAALSIALADVAAGADLPFRFAIIAMGRLGGGEVGYGSDADVLFVYDPRPGVPADIDVGKLANEVAARLRSLLSSPSASDPALTIDADLRPEGRSGPLARSLASYAKYYARWSAPWEAQALLRARLCAGEATLGEQFAQLIDPVRYPAGGLSAQELIEIRRIKARVDTERIPRGSDASVNAKLGKGGLADIEWTVQLLQLAHGAEVPGLRSPQTNRALDAAAEAGLIDVEQRDTLQNAWRGATHVRNAIMLATGKAGDSLPHQGIALRMIGRILGYPPGFDHGQVLDDYRRAARHARKVVEDVFYD